MLALYIYLVGFRFEVGVIQDGSLNNRKDEDRTELFNNICCYYESMTRNCHTFYLL